MATILDISLLNFLLPIFVFSLTFVFIYAILQKTELFGNAGKNQALNLIAAFSVAAISVFAGTITGIVSIVTPWIVFIIFILVMLFGMYRFFGIEDSKTWDNIGGPTLIFVIILIVILIALSTVFESQVSPYGDSSDTGVKSQVLKTLTHPRLLGALFILIIASFSVRFLSETVVPK